MCKAFPPCTNFRNKTAKYSAVQNSYLAARLSNDQARPWRGARGAVAPGPQIPGAPFGICTCVEYVLRQKRNVGRLGKVKRQRFIGRGVGDFSISKSSYQFLINLLFPFRRREKATRRWQPERLTARRQVEPSVLSACAAKFATRLPVPLSCLREPCVRLVHVFI
jgi:hypothetical protein